MTESEKAEVLGMVMALRQEILRELGQFERDKVGAVDERGRMAIKVQQDEIRDLNQAMDDVEALLVVAQEDIDGLQEEVVALGARVTLCEGRITRLEAKP